MSEEKELETVAVKKDKRKKKDYADFPDGKKPRLIALDEQTDIALTKDGKRVKRELKPHCEFILEQYAKGNVKIKKDGSSRWVGIQPENSPGQKSE